MAYTTSSVLTTTTLVKYLKKKVEPIYRRSVFMGGLKEHGCQSFGAVNSGEWMEWRPVVSRAKLVAQDPYNVQTSFPSRNRRIKLTLPWRVYGLGEKIVKFDRLANRGNDVQFVKLVDDCVKQMASDFVEDFREKLYVDGSASATSQDIHGLQSCTGGSELVTSGYVADPDDSYAGKTTDLGDQGGTWSGTWPDGTGSTEYHCMSPIMVDVNNSGFTGDTWSENWQEALNFLLLYMGRLNNRDPDAVILNTEWMRQAMDSLATNDRFLVDGNTRTSNLGHKAILYKGIELYHEYACPSDMGFAFNWDNLELRSMQDELIGTEGDFEIDSSDQLKKLDFYGNLQIWLPGQLGVLKEVSTAGS